MSTTWLTADEHFFHRNIIGYSGRPFSDVEEMNIALVQNLNRVVTNDDTVYHLGDFSLDERVVRQFIKTLHGKHILLPGNHDAAHPRKGGFKNKAKKYVDWGFTQVFLEPFIDFSDVIGIPRVMLSHCPSADYEDPRYPDYRPPMGSYNVLLHGHVHEKWRVKRNPNGSLMINCGVDQWDMAPVALETIKELIKTAP